MMLVVWLMIFGPQGKQVWWELLKVPALLALTLLGYRLLAATALSRWLLRARQKQDPDQPADQRGSAQNRASAEAGDQGDAKGLRLYSTLGGTSG